MSSTAARPRTARLRPLAALVMAAALLVGCSSEEPTLNASPTSLPLTTESTAATTTTEPVLLTDLPASELNVLGFIATPKGPPEVFSAPDETSARIEVPATTDIGAPTTFAVIGNPEAQPEPWLKVMLPVRPNDAAGWVRASSVDVTHTDLKVLVDLEGRSLRVLRAGAEIFRADTAIGTEADPTPTGPSFLVELIENVNPSNAYGPYAFGLSLHSDTQTEFAGGDGRVGIHGTNQPQLIGQRVSHGCVRLNNDDIRALVDLQLPLGVPIFVT